MRTLPFPPGMQSYLVTVLDDCPAGDVDVKVRLVGMVNPQLGRKNDKGVSPTQGAQPRVASEARGGHTCWQAKAKRHCVQSLMSRERLTGPMQTVQPRKPSMWSASGWPEMYTGKGETDGSGWRAGPRRRRCHRCRRAEAYPCNSPVFPASRLRRPLCSAAVEKGGRVSPAARSSTRVGKRKHGRSGASQTPRLLHLKNNRLVLLLFEDEAVRGRWRRRRCCSGGRGGRGGRGLGCCAGSLAAFCLGLALAVLAHGIERRGMEGERQNRAATQVRAQRAAWAWGPGALAAP